MMKILVLMVEGSLSEASSFSRDSIQFRRFGDDGRKESVIHKAGGQCSTRPGLLYIDPTSV